MHQTLQVDPVAEQLRSAVELEPVFAAFSARVLQLADGRIVSDQRNARRLAPQELVW